LGPKRPMKAEERVFRTAWGFGERAKFVTSLPGSAESLTPAKEKPRRKQRLGRDRPVNRLEPKPVQAGAQGA